MALTLTGRVLLSCACVVAIIAAFWPETGPAPRVELTNPSQDSGSDAGTGGSGGGGTPTLGCPLGYTGSVNPHLHAGAASYPHAQAGDGSAIRHGPEPTEGPPPHTQPVALMVPPGGHKCSGAVSDDAHDQATTRLPYHVFHNARIWTAADGDPHAEAMLVCDGVLVAVGTTRHVLDTLAGALGLAGEGAEVLQPPQAAPGAAGDGSGGGGGGSGGGGAAGHPGVVWHDLGGRTVVPGFVDAHTHVLTGGLALGPRVDLAGAASREEVAARVAAAAAGLGPGEWVQGGGWDETHWRGAMPTSDWIDKAAGGRPTLLHRHDMHMALASREALRLAGLDRTSPDPPGGSLDRDPATGQLTGILREAAVTLLAAAMPEPSPAELRAALSAAARHALSRGVTTMADMGRFPLTRPDAPLRDLQDVYVPAADAGELPLRVFAYVPLPAWLPLSSWVAQHGRAHPSGRLFWGGLKAFADGSLGSRTALFWAPYDDAAAAGVAAAHATGQRAVPLEELREMVKGAAVNGLQVAIHAIGDRAVDDVIEVYGEALGVAALMPDAQQEAEDQERQQQQQQQHYQQQQQRKLQDTSDQGTKKAVTQDAHEDDVASAVGMEGTADGGAGAGTTAEAGGGRTHSGGPHGGDGGGGGGKCPFGFDRMAEAAARVYETEGGEGPWGAAGAAREEQQRRRMQRLGDRLRLRIEHVQHVSDPARVSASMAALGITPVPNPLHMASDVGLLLPRLGPQRAPLSFPLGAMVAAGLQPAMTSDWPVVGLEPLQSIMCATASREAGAAAVGGGEWGREWEAQRVSWEVALKGHTVWGARAVGLEGLVGSLEVGKRADFVELDGDVGGLMGAGAGTGGEGWGCGEEAEVQVVRTWVDGVAVYERKKGGA